GQLLGDADADAEVGGDACQRVYLADEFHFCLEMMLLENHGVDSAATKVVFLRHRDGAFDARGFRLAGRGRHGSFLHLGGSWEPPVISVDYSAIITTYI